MFRAEILADVVRGVPERLSPAGTQQLINVEIIKSNIYINTVEQLTSQNVLLIYNKPLTDHRSLFLS